MENTTGKGIDAEFPTRVFIQINSEAFRGLGFYRDDVRALEIEEGFHLGHNRRAGDKGTRIRRTRGDDAREGSNKRRAGSRSGKRFDLHQRFANGECVTDVLL